MKTSARRVVAALGDGARVVVGLGPHGQPQRGLGGVEGFGLEVGVEPSAREGRGEVGGAVGVGLAGVVVEGLAGHGRPGLHGGDRRGDLDVGQPGTRSSSWVAKIGAVRSERLATTAATCPPEMVPGEPRLTQRREGPEPAGGPRQPGGIRRRSSAPGSAARRPSTRTPPGCPTRWCHRTRRPRRRSWPPTDPARPTPRRGRRRRPAGRAAPRHRRDPRS